MIVFAFVRASGKSVIPVSAVIIERTLVFRIQKLFILGEKEAKLGVKLFS